MCAMGLATNESNPVAFCEAINLAREMQETEFPEPDAIATSESLPMMDASASNLAQISLSVKSNQTDSPSKGN